MNVGWLTDRAIEQLCACREGPIGSLDYPSNERPFTVDAAASIEVSNKLCRVRIGLTKTRNRANLQVKFTACLDDIPRKPPHLGSQIIQQSLYLKATFVTFIARKYSGIS
jgi:hypothetical protein